MIEWWERIEWQSTRDETWREGPWVGCRRRLSASGVTCSMLHCPIPTARLRLTGSRTVDSRGGGARRDQRLLDQCSEELVLARDGGMPMGAVVLEECENIREVPLVKISLAKNSRAESTCWDFGRRKWFDYYLVGTRRTVFVEGYPGERCGGECGCGDLLSDWNLV